MVTEVNLNVVANNRKPIGMVGSNLGGKVFRASAREAWADFEKERIEVANNDDIELILNRSPRRYRMTDVDILSASIRKDATGASKLFLNEGTDNEIALPIGKGMEKFATVSDEAIGAALRGDKSKVFGNPTKLATILNTYNRDEKARLERIIEKCQKMIQQIDSTVSENEKKASVYERELYDSASGIEVSRVPGNTIVVESANTED